MKIIRIFIGKFETLPHQCVIFFYEERGKLALIEHVWDHMPTARDLAHSKEWQAWFNKSYSQLEAQYGYDAVRQVESKHHALEDNRYFAGFLKTVMAAASSHALSGVIKTRDAIRSDASPRPASSPIYLGSIG